jgi:rod shape-determining protein MreD
MATVLKPANGTVYIVLTLLCAMVLQLLPLPTVMELSRPEFVLMVLIYWSMALPNRIGVSAAWITGLFVDVLLGTPLGINALAYSLIVYVIARFYLQLRQYPYWQQALIIFALVLLAKLVNLVMNTHVEGVYLLLPAIISAALWPFNYLLLRLVRRTFNVS